MATAKTLRCFDTMNVGMKLCTNAPSAKIRRNRLGSLNATKKISEKILAPRIDAIRRSRTKPKIRDVKIPALVVKIERKRMKYRAF